MPRTPASFHDQFCADLPSTAQATLMCATQRPIPGASHAVGVSHPNETARLVLEAAAVHVPASA